jgi:hypothetical protein
MWVDDVRRSRQAYFVKPNMDLARLTLELKLPDALTLHPMIHLDQRRDISDDGSTDMKINHGAFLVLSAGCNDAERDYARGQHLPLIIARHKPQEIVARDKRGGIPTS